MTGRQWMPVDAWLRDRPTPRRRVLGYQILTPGRPPPAPRTAPVHRRYPKPPTSGQDPWPELLRRIDQAVAVIRRQHKRVLAGRRAALLENPDLAREVYQLVKTWGVEASCVRLDFSRQALHDVWNRHGWPAPLGSGNARERKTA